jgi:hypothetical protein
MSANLIPYTPEEQFVTQLADLRRQIEQLKFNQAPTTYTNQFLFESAAQSGYFGYALLGADNLGGTILNDPVSCTVYVPATITVTAVSVIARVAPSYVQTSGGGAFSYAQTDTIKLWASSQTIRYTEPFASTPFAETTAGLTDLTNTVFGVASWSPAADGAMHELAGAIPTAQITPGTRQVFYLQGTATNTSLGKLYIVVTGNLTP